MLRIEPPFGIRAEARRAQSTKLKAEISMARRKPSRVVLSTNEPFSSSLLAKAIEWTKKSREPKAFSTVAKAASIEASSWTSTAAKTFTPMLSARGSTRRSMPGRCRKAISAPWAASWQAMPQAMDWWFATPVTIPFLPFIRSPLSI